MTVHVWSSYAISSYIYCFYLITFYLLFIHALYSTCPVLDEAICYVQVFQDTSIWFSALQVLDLCVSEFFLCSHTHILSLESIDGFCHGIDCKIVIYNYVLCWL